MLGAKRDQRCTGSGAPGGMGRVAPINEKWNKPICRQRPLIGDMPGEKNACWCASASWYHVANRHTAAPRVGDELRQVGSLCGPCDEPRPLQIVDSKFPGTGRFGLIRIRTDDLEVGRWTKSDKRVARALAWMLSSGCGLDAQQRLDLLDTSRQVRRRVDQMINPGEQSARIARLRV